MLKILIGGFYGETQRYFDLLIDCDVCNNTGVLIPRRPQSGYPVLDRLQSIISKNVAPSRSIDGEFCIGVKRGEAHLGL
jgi:hypothetical protein